MHIRIPVSGLQSLINAVKGAAPKKATMPILSSFLLVAEEGGRVTVIATDLDISIRAIGTCDVLKPGSVCLPAQKMAEIARALPGPTVEILLLDNRHVQVTAARTKFKVGGFDASEFPKTPETKGGTLKVDPALLREMLDRVLYSVSADESRYILQGVYCLAKGDVMTMASTDGHRMATCSREIAGVAQALKTPVILPSKGLNELRRIADPKVDEGDVAMTFGESRVSAERGNVVLTVRLIGGKYPDFEQVIPKDGSRRVKLSSEVLSDGLARMGVIVGHSNSVRVDITKDQVRLTSTNPDAGEATEEIPVEYAGDDLKIGFNASYLKEAVESLGSNEVEIVLSDELSPGLLRPVGGAADLAVVMPMRI